MRSILEGKKVIHGFVSPVKYTKEKTKDLFERPHDMTSQLLKILCVFTVMHIDMCVFTVMHIDMCIFTVMNIDKNRHFAYFHWSTSSFSMVQGFNLEALGILSSPAKY